MNYSITPVTKILRENDIPTSPLVKGRGRSTGNYGNVVWYQKEDGYSWSKSHGSPMLSFEIKGRWVYDQMVEVLEDNGVELEKAEPNHTLGGYISIDLNQFYSE